MKVFKLPRQVTWLLPGLSIKRWVSIAAVGMFCLLLGLALMLNMQPVTFVIELLKELALLIPNTQSGPVLFTVGVLAFYFGMKKTYGTVKTAMQHEGLDADILEALYRQNKLMHGPRIVAVGGGTGLSTILRGLKHYTNNITAVVTVGDDGGSSGRLREEQGIIPPGDIRNCIAALADEEQLITELFQYRFKTGSGLEGHSFGNLFLTAMCRITGDMFSAIKESSKVLNIQGRVLPSTLDNVKLVAEMEDGSVIYGESHIPLAKGKIERLKCVPECPHALPDVVDAIEKAELIILGPGSLYTSVLPNILIDDIAKAISKSASPKVYVCNIMTQPGETDGYSVADHIQAIQDHAAYANVVDVVFVNSWLPDDLLAKYRDAGYMPVVLDADRVEQQGVKVVEKFLMDEKDPRVIRHNPRQLARAVVKWYKHEYQHKAKAVKKTVILTPQIVDADPTADLLKIKQ